MNTMRKYIPFRMKYNHIIILQILILIMVHECFAQDKKHNISTNNTIDSVIVLKIEDTVNVHNLMGCSSLQFLQKKSLVITNHSYLHQLRIWKLKDGSIDTTFFYVDSLYIYDLVVSHDEEKIIFSLGYNESICCYSILNKCLLWKVDNVKFYNGLGVSMDDSLVYAVGPWYVTALDANTGKIVKKDRKFMGDYLLPQLRNMNVLFSPSGRYALYWKNAGFNHINFRLGSRLNVWDLLNDEMVASKFINGKGVWSASFLPNEKNILTGSFDGKLRLWSLENNSIINSWEIHKKNKKNGFSEILQTILPKEAVNFLGTEGYVNGKWGFVIWKYPIMKAERMFYSGDYCSATFSNDGKYLIISHSGYLCLYETDSWKLLWRVPIIRENKKEK